MRVSQMPMSLKLCNEIYLSKPLIEKYGYTKLQVNEPG